MGQKYTLTSYNQDLFLTNVISLKEYSKCEKKEKRKDIFRALCLNHEENNQVNKSKAIVLVKQYKLFQMEEDETILKMFSRFSIMVFGQEFLTKIYTIVWHVKNILRSLSTK